MSATKCRGVGRSWAGLNCDRWKRAFAAELLWRFCLANQLQIWCRSGRNSAQQSLPSENPPLIASCISRTSRLTLCDVRADNRVFSTHYYTVHHEQTIGAPCGPAEQPPEDGGHRLLGLRPQQLLHLRAGAVASHRSRASNRQAGRGRGMCKIR